MSGGPPHHPHSRQIPTANTAWNHLQVPSYFPSRQPQHAHMSNEHSLHHHPSWHTPTTTEALKTLPHSHLFGLEQMLSTDCFPRHAPGVDLSVTRNGSQNGDLPTSPISLSVRDTNKINSLPPGALEIQAVELAKCTSPIAKSLEMKPAVSPGLKTFASSIVDSSKGQKRSNIRVDSILERLNPSGDKTSSIQEQSSEKSSSTVNEKPATPQSVIVQATTTSSTHDENSNSSGIINVPTPTNLREEDTVSSYSNEDSLDSNKSRRKRKPSKTVRVSKEEEKVIEENNETTKPVPQEKEVKDPVNIVSKILEENKIPERRRSSDDLDTIIPAKTRRKTSSESETIDNIAAMVQEGLKEKTSDKKEEIPEIIEETVSSSKPISVSVIKTKENSPEPVVAPSVLVTPAQKKETNTHFVEVENKLEEMFAGIEDTTSDPLKTDNITSDLINLDLKSEDDSLLKLEESITLPSSTSIIQTEFVEESSEVLPSTSASESIKKKTPSKKTKRKASTTPSNSRRNSDVTTDTPSKKKSKNNKKSKTSTSKSGNNNLKNKKSVNGKTTNNINKSDVVKDIYAYDSGSNASSSRSRGPFIQIKGPRDSPISVNVINTPISDDHDDKKSNKPKKFHDDSEYRRKVRSKGLHCSTLSNKYDAQTKDISWICAFCKRGPHASELTGPTSDGEVIPPGDLFGPYFISTECPEYENHLNDPYDTQFKSKKITKVLLEESANVSAKSSKKSKRKHSESDNSSVYLGITETGNKTYEVWAHEDCIVWSPGTHLVGTKIVGLEEAVWTACNVTCKLCHLKGANICCLKRGCMNMMHLCCSRFSNWQFDDENYKVYCPLHKIP